MRAATILVVLMSTGAASADPLVFSADETFVDGKARLLQRQDARGLSTFPLSSKELRRRLRDDEPSPSEASASPFLFWHPYVAAWTGLSADLDDSTLVFDSIAPMGALGANLTDGDVFGGHVRIDLSPIRSAFVGDGVFAPWQPEGYVNLDWPRESWLSVTTDHLTLIAGRLKSGIGHGVFGNPFLNGRAPFYDQAQATFHTDSFRMFWMVGTSSSFLSAPEGAIQSFGSVGPPRAGFDPLNNYDSARFDAPAKTFMYRRFEWAPWKWISLGIGEMGVVGGKWPDLSQVLPVVAWHNAYAPGSSNVMMSVDASVSPLPGVLLFGEALLDDFASPYEAATSKPNSTAVQLGAQWFFPLGDRLSSSLAAEVTHVDQWTYARWQPYLVMQQRQILPCGCTAVDVPLGYPQGGDVDHAGVQYTLTGPGGFRLTAGLEGMMRGPVRLGEITGIVLKDSAGNDVKDAFGEPVLAPLYYDLDTYGGPGALDALLAVPDEIHGTMTVTAQIPLAPHLTLLGTGWVSSIDNVDNVAGAHVTRAMIHGGLRLQL